ncbi:phage regulatory protein/antirepressor Ant [Prevotella sp.]|uniref:phage regulatory protein/antirepressor Ant n=1 Tax=Prevotella sp. TaxID=59823 RepID=UPI002A7F49CF|nr:phage regulatory protein/antirepressor Ant [Prevotella sp.]MDD7189686.1 phage regulatory protein/antirepressor Ant [Prevotella sp.]MDY4644662.1 phage regulatory protein/antirepressor Ant [Prevotella sp.]
MTDLIIKKETMTSLEIAEVTGKRHDSILRDIRNILSQGVDAHNFVETSYTDKSNRQQKCYTLTKKGCLILASGYDVILREKIINRWEELETKERNKYQVPQSFAEALMLAAKQQEQIEEQQRQLEANSKEIVELNGAIAEMEPKVTYVDMILASKETVTTTQIAQDYGQSAKAFNVLLRNFGVQHKVGGQWVLYAKHLPFGYVQSDTFPIVHKNGTNGTVMHTKWTQKGRLFLYEELKKHNIIPLIEQNKKKEEE